MRLAAWAGLLLLGFGAHKIYKISTSLPDLQAGEVAKVQADVDVNDPQFIVQKYLKDNRVVVFSKTYCGFSKRAKDILSSHLGTEYTTVELDTRPDGAALQDYLAEITGGRTVPRVFIDGTFIGGADDTGALDRSGKLASMFKERGIL